MSLSTVLLAVTMIAWGISLLGVSVPAVVLGVLALATGIALLAERYFPFHRAV
jgi:hypothetical protein